MFSLLQAAKDFQSLIAGVIGFGGVILTLNRNATLVREQQERQNAHDAKVLRRALRAELTVIRNTPQINVETIDKVKDDVEGIFVPTRPMVDIYPELLAKIGLLSESEIGVVMQAYALIAQLNDRIGVIAAQIQPKALAAPAGFFFVPNGALTHVKALESGYLEVVSRAIAALEAAAISDITALMKST